MRTTSYMIRRSLWATVALCACGVSAGARAEDAPATPPKAEPAPAAQPAAPPPAQPAADPRDEEIKLLRKQLEEINRRLEELEKAKKAEPPPPPPTTPTPELPPAPAPDPNTPRRGSATLIPNISVVGELQFRGGDSKLFPGRGRSHLQELELAFQDAVAPNIRYDVFLAAEKEESWNVGLEEGFLTWSGIGKGLNLYAGRQRTRFGKFNQLHPHQWVFISQPSVHAALLGDHGMMSDGATLEYILPFKSFFGALQLGAMQTTSAHGHEEEDGGDGHAHAKPRRTRLLGNPRQSLQRGELGFHGGEQGSYNARLWFSKALGRDRELEFGLGRYWGRGELDFGRRMQALNGVDLTYRSYPGAYKRWIFQTEFISQETQGIRGSTKQRPGAWAMLAYRWDRYWEGGMRLDYTRYPFPMEGKEYGGSLFLTKYLTEQTSLRLEYRHAKTPDFGSGNGIYFQILFGSGPHTHPLQ